MAKLAQSTSKYCVHAKFEVDGVVERPDVIGAVFGQTEGLLGSDMDLRDLQKTGRIGRVDVSLEVKDGKTVGTIDIPSSLDASETALIAATLETIERIGPCDTKININKIEDVRAGKRQYLLERAKQLLTSTFDESDLESQEISEQLKESVRGAEVMEYKGLPAGPGIETSDSVIICEGRADVVKLLKNGIKNVIAIEGTSVPDAVVELSKQKETTAFLDGDRGGDLILKEMKSRGVQLDFVARAPDGKEVEDLTKKEIYKHLREKVKESEARFVSESAQKPAKTFERRERRPRKEYSKPAGDRITKARLSEEETKVFKEIYEKVKGSDSAYILDNSLQALGKVPIANISSAIREVSGAKAIITDGTIDQRMIFAASKAGVGVLMGKDVEEGARMLKGVGIVLTADI